MQLYIFKESLMLFVFNPLKIQGENKNSEVVRPALFHQKR